METLNEKCSTLSKLATRFDSELGLTDAQKKLGGDLFLGKFYAKSPRIFLGLNPGGSELNDFCTKLWDDNFWNTPELCKPYWPNCRKFLDAAPGLRDWMDEATVSFCVPWRTKGDVELRKLNKMTGEKVASFSGQLIRAMIDDHRAIWPNNNIVAIAVGKASLEWLAREDFLNFDWKAKTVHGNGGTGIYQWRKVTHGDLAIYQVPHFSWAHSLTLRKQCAEWLAADLGLTCRTNA